MAVSKRTRFEIFKRDKFCCQYCGRTPPTVVLEVDHVTAVSNGGSDDETNLLTSCFDCNRGKSNIPLGVVVPGVAERLAREQEIADQVEAYNAFLMDRRKKQDDDIEEIGMHWFNQWHKKKNRFVFGTARQTSIRTFLKYLPKAVILDAIERSHAKIHVYGDNDEKCFKYFCGVCWGIIKQNGGGGT